MKVKQFVSLLFPEVFFYFQYLSVEEFIHYGISLSKKAHLKVAIRESPLVSGDKKCSAFD
jgi:hypothetical protein